MSLLYTDNKDEDIVNMIAAEVSFQSRFSAISREKSREKSLLYAC